MTDRVQIVRIPIVGLPPLRCDVRVDEQGRALDDAGEPVGGHRKCGKDGVWAIGAIHVCREHWPDVCRVVGGWDPAEIERELADLYGWEQPSTATELRQREADEIIREFHEACWEYDGDLPDDIQAAAAHALRYLGDVFSLPPDALGEQP